MTIQYRKFSHPPRREKGAVLIFGLVMLVLLTLIGLAAMNDVDVQERMSGNLMDQSLAFQSAEAALRFAEQILDQEPLSSFDGSNTGFWPDLNITANRQLLNAQGATVNHRRPYLWTDEQWQSNSLQLAADTLDGVAEQPRYTIERITVTNLAATRGSGVDVESQEKFSAVEYYRITARGVGISDNSVVILQSTYAPLS